MQHSTNGATNYEEDSVLPQSWQKRPEPMSDEAWEKSQATLEKVVNFWMPNWLFNPINKVFS